MCKNCFILTLAVPWLTWNIDGIIIKKYGACSNGGLK